MFLEHEAEKLNQNNLVAPRGIDSRWKHPLGFRVDGIALVA